MEEIWKDIDGYEGMYQVSSLGRVKTLARYKVKECIRKLVSDKNGYMTVRLTYKKVGKTYKIHRLVATAFISNPEGYNEVNHKNEKKDDNRVENLEWCDKTYNVNYGTANSRRRAHSINCSFTSKRVVQKSLSGEVIAIYPSLSEAHRKTGFSMASLSLCCNGKIRKSYGYNWEYAS